MHSIKRTNMPEIKPKRSLYVLPGLMVLACSVLMVPVADAAKPKAVISKLVPAIEGTTVSLDGSHSSDADNDKLTFTWKQLKGVSVSLDKADTATASFKAPVIVRTNSPTKPISLSFQLSVNDGTATVNKTVAVTVKPEANKLPVADAGSDRTVNWDAAGAGVTLDGSKSKDEDGKIVKHQWKLLTPKALPKKAVFKLNSANTEKASFTLTSQTQSSPVDLEFELAVTDNDKKVSKATVHVIVSQVQVVPAPVANAGADQNVTSGATVNLNGGASTGADSYLWKQTAGTPLVTLSGDSTSTASFTAPTVTTATPLTFELTTTNASGSTKDTVVVTVAPKALPLPVANAGVDQSVAGGATVNLSGSASTGADTYAWAQTAGSPLVTLSSTNTAATSFKAPAVTQGTKLTFELTATNSVGSTKATVSVTVTPAVVGALAAELSLPVGDIDINDPANPVIKNITGGTAPYSVTYDWGDGQTSQPKTLDAGKNTDTGEHYYAADGSYNVKVTVMDAANAKFDVTGSIKATTLVGQCK